METARTRRERILQIGERPGFQTAVRSLLGADVADSLAEHLERCRSARFTVAVLGPQGVGKSSLINALLRRPLLPAGAQRTADVVCLAFPPGDGAAVNPDQPAILLADTPGYDSACPEHELATRQFLRHAAAAIFLFPTTPPLLRPDLAFLRTVRSYCRRLFFVQVTNGEDPEQVELARQYNARQLGAVIGEEPGAGPFVDPIYLIDIRAALAAPDEAAFAAAGAGVLASDLAASVAPGPHALTLRDAHLAVVSAAWRVRRALAERREQLETTLARIQTETRTASEEAGAAAQAAAIRLQQTLAAFQTELRLAERDWAERLTGAAHRVEVELADFIGQGSSTRPVLGERASALWQIASRELEIGLSVLGDQLAERLGRQLGRIRQPAGAPRPAPDLGCAPAAMAQGSTFTLAVPTSLDLSRYADMFTNGAREECWRRAQAYFDQLARWAETEVAAARQSVDERKQRADQAADERRQAAERTQQQLNQLVTQVQINEALLSELQALVAEALL